MVFGSGNALNFTIREYQVECREQRRWFCLRTNDCVWHCCDAVLVDIYKTKNPKVMNNFKYQQQNQKNK